MGPGMEHVLREKGVSPMRAGPMPPAAKGHVEHGRPSMKMHLINKRTVNSQPSFLTVSVLLIKFDRLLQFVCNPNIHMLVLS